MWYTFSLIFPSENSFIVFHHNVSDYCVPHLALYIIVFYSYKTLMHIWCMLTRILTTSWAIFLSNQVVKAGVNLKFAPKLSFLFSSEFAALGIKLCYGKIIFHLFSLFLPFWAILKFPLWLMAWLPWQREEHFLIFQLFITCFSGNQAPNGQDLSRDTSFSLIWRVF